MHAGRIHTRFIFWKGSLRRLSYEDGSRVATIRSAQLKQKEQYELCEALLNQPFRTTPF